MPGCTLPGYTLSWPCPYCSIVYGYRVPGGYSKEALPPGRASYPPSMTRLRLVMLDLGI